MPTSLLLTTILTLSTLPSADAPLPGHDPAAEPSLAEAEPGPAELAELAEPGIDEPAPDAVFDALRARLDPEALAYFDTLDPTQIQALLEKIDAGEPLSEPEQAVALGIQGVIVEQFDAELDYQTGDIDLGEGLAVLHLGDDFRFLDSDDAQKVVEDAWGNPPGLAPLGMIVPARVSPLDPEEGYGVLITYVADGYVEDDDAEDIDYDDLLEQMQEGTEAENAGRRSQGYPVMHLRGWAEPPHYDAASHRLYWAKELALDDPPVSSLNYSIRVLGRRGVLELNAVASMDQLPAIKPEMEKVLSRVEFSTGHRYEDFDPDLDSVAAYGIGGLIAGKVLAKAGFFAVILKFLIAAKKLLLVGLIAIGVAVKSFFNRKNRPSA